MKNRNKIFLVFGVLSVAALVAVAFFVVPGCMRCYGYYRLINEYDDGLARLSGELRKMDIGASEGGEVVSLGYAEFRIEPERIDVIRFCNEETRRVLVESGDMKIIFTLPWSWSDPVSWEETSKLAISELDHMGFRIRAESAKMKGKSYGEIFWMDGDEFAEYMILAWPKVCVGRPNGASIFETGSLRGIMRQYEGEKDARLNAQLFSKESNLAVDIMIIGADERGGKEMLGQLMGSFRFVISQIPGEDELREMIKESIEGHEKYVSIDRAD